MAVIEHLTQVTINTVNMYYFVNIGYGITTDGVTTFVNASTCNYSYRPVQPPIVFDIPNRIC